MNVYQSMMPALENSLPIHIGIAICNPHTENQSHFRLLDKDPFLYSISRAFFSTLIHEDIHPKVHSSCLTGGFSWQLWAWLDFYTNTSIPAPLQASLQNTPVSTAAEQFKCSYLLRWIPSGQTVPRDDLYPSPESNTLRPKKALWPGTGVTTAIITSSANKLLIASTAEAIREPRRTQNHCVSNSQRLF